MKKVLITGGAGFVGSHLADRLLSKGCKVLVIDNFATGRRDNLLPHDNLELVEGSIVDNNLVTGLFSKFSPDVVVHAAASYKDPNNWVEDTQTNVLGSVNVVKAAMENGVKRIINFQTSLCYGLEPIEQPITLEHPYFSGKSQGGGSSYAISKTAGEMYVELSGIDFVSFRLANAYGPRNISGPLPVFYQRLTEGKECFVADTRRDFIFVMDLIDLVEKAVNGVGHGYYHASSGADYSIKELFDATLKALDIKLDKEVEVKPRGKDDVYTILIDPSKTYADYNWKTSTILAEGIAETINYYKKFGITQAFTHLKSN
jgi:UDP-glucose 4-epimerase